jgi:mRNA interferase MazF
VIARGEVWWAELGDPAGSEPGFRRPVVVVQANAFNRSAIRTTIVVALTSNLRLLDAPGNVLIARRTSGLAKDSIANVSQLYTIDAECLAERVGAVPAELMSVIDRGLRQVLEL